ncbi:MAG: hypothetical protein U1F43_30185 [Myxococcota bacterium]
MLKLTLGLGLALTCLATAAHADDPVVRVKSSKVANCNTDGGDVRCSEGNQLIAKGLPYAIEELNVSCPGAKPGKYKVTLTYEYNGGEVFFMSHVMAEKDRAAQTIKSTPLTDESTLTDGFGGKPKKLPGLPACLREKAMPKAAELILKWFELVQPIDPESDVRADYQLVFDVAPAKE